MGCDNSGLVTSEKNHCLHFFNGRSEKWTFTTRKEVTNYDGPRGGQVSE